MIAANELRIGNWVSGNFPNMIVQQINKYSVECYMPESESDDFCFELEELHPIPLTPEILEKAGFDKDMRMDKYFGEDIFWMELYYVNGSLYFGSWIDSGFNKLSMKPIQYIHQLQNLYWCLTGEELEIKL